MKPIVGITSRFMVKDNHYAIGANYINAVKNADGIPFQIPVNQIDVAKRLIALVDGVIIPGGADVAPLLYGEQPLPQVTRTYRCNDEFEMELVREAYRQHKPVLGICRGIQVINVAFGGTLYQDIPSQTRSLICHYQDASTRGELTHSIVIDPDSFLFRIMGIGAVNVNSYHHQSIKGVARELRVSATAPDGIIEAVESEDGMLIGVQWHPESLYSHCAEQAKLIADLVRRCTDRG